MFAAIVRANRQRLGLTQEELAAKAGLSVRGIRKIEAGRIGAPRPATVRLLADAFGFAGADRERFCQAAAGEPTGPWVRSAAPAQLPADVSAFTGREQQLSQLNTLLTGAGGKATAVVISALSGTAGVGKTALAVHWAHRVADRFPDGQLYVNLRGYDPDQPTDPGEALTRLLSVLGVTGQDVPQELDERAARYRSELADRRMLIVLDNAGSVEQVRPLLPGSSSCTVLVTSRDSLAGLVAVHGAHRLELDLLSPAEAIALLRRLIGARCDAEPEAAAMLAELCARLPLVLRVAAELAVSRPTILLAELVAELAGKQRRLDLLGSGGYAHAAVRTVFSWSLQHLPPDAAGTFRLLGLHPGADMDAYAVAALAGTSVEDARRQLELLARAHLVQPTSASQHGMHDLLRAYAAELASDHDTDQARHAALRRLLDHYRHTVSVAMDLAYPYERERRPRVPPVDTLAPDLSDADQAIGWLDTELPNLLATARHSADHGSPEHLLDMSAIMHRHLRTRGRYGDAEALHLQALTTARRTSHGQGELNALVNLGDIRWRQGRFKQATENFERALELADATGSHTGALYALIGLGTTHRRGGRYQESLTHYRRALDIARTSGNRAGEHDVEIDLGNIDQRQGRYHESLAHYRQALKIARAIGYRAGEQNGLFGLGNVHRLQGRLEQSLAYYRQALEIARATGHRTAEQSALLGLSRAQIARGDYQVALNHCELALKIAQTIGFRDAEVDARLVVGRAYLLQGQYERASDCYQRVLVAGVEAGDPNWQFESRLGLGRIQQTTGHPEGALAHLRQALQLATDLAQGVDQARAHDRLARARSALNQPEQARRHWRQALDILTNLGIDHTGEPETSVSSIRANLAVPTDR
jgi:tetratricopeptide (TPR) repeat protein/transcriptional regulator with XRE-family HTH domain